MAEPFVGEAVPYSADLASLSNLRQLSENGLPIIGGQNQPTLKLNIPTYEGPLNFSADGRFQIGQKEITDSNDSTFFGPDGWQQCTPASLRGHIVNAHLRPDTLQHGGLPLYDVEIAQVRGVGLGWVVRKAVQRLELTDGELHEVVEAHRVDDAMTPGSYRTLLVKTIKLISHLGMAQVPWGAINKIYPGASSVGVIGSEDKTDASFKETHAGREAAEARLAREAFLPTNKFMSDTSILVPGSFEDSINNAYKVNLS